MMMFTLTGSVSTLVTLASVSAGVVTTLLVCGASNTLETAEVRLLTSHDACHHQGELSSPGPKPIVSKSSRPNPNQVLSPSFKTQLNPKGPWADNNILLPEILSPSFLFFFITLIHCRWTVSWASPWPRVVTTLWWTRCRLCTSVAGSGEQRAMTSGETIWRSVFWTLM